MLNRLKTPGTFPPGMPTLREEALTINPLYRPPLKNVPLTPARALPRRVQCFFQNEVEKMRCAYCLNPKSFGLIINHYLRLCSRLSLKLERFFFGAVRLGFVTRSFEAKFRSSAEGFGQWDFRDVSFNEFFNHGELPHVALIDKSDGGAGGGGASRAPYAVNVVFGVGGDVPIHD